MDDSCTLCLAGKTVTCRFVFKKNLIRCRRFICEDPGEGQPVRVTDAEKDVFFAAYPEDSWGPEAESKLLIMLVSDALLPDDRLLFHSAAFSWEGKAWLLTAPSGTGKTTQLCNLKEVLGDGVRVICGDNPVLRFPPEGAVMVHPSPWNGKENYGGGEPVPAEGVPLAGIVYLRQAGENRIERFLPRDAVAPVFREMNTFSRTTEAVRKLLSLEERLITAVPLWQFHNTGTVEGSRLLAALLTDQEGKRDDL